MSDTTDTGTDTGVIYDSGNIEDEAIKDTVPLRDLVAHQFFGWPSYGAVNNSNKELIRQWMREFFSVAGNITNTIDEIENGTFNFQGSKGIILKNLFDKRDILDEFTQNYVNVIDFSKDGEATGDNTESEIAGYTLEYLVTKVYAPAAANLILTGEIDEFSLLQEEIDKMGTATGQKFHFKPAFDYLDTNKTIRNVLLRPGKFRNDTPPTAIAKYQCRIGASTFHVPPTSINVHQAFKAGSITNGVLRQPNSPKMNLGHSETHITMTLYFPNHETIWGFAGNRADFDIFNWDPSYDHIPSGGGEAARDSYVKSMVSDRVIDRYLSSLRGLVTQFKYTPFLPIRNEYLNRTYDITGVTMVGMTVQTVPDFPFVLAVTLEMAEFNHKPFLPMIDDFDNAIHWGKFRMYCGRAAARLDAKVNQGFLIEKPIGEPVLNDDGTANPSTSVNTVTAYEANLTPRFDKASEIANGMNFDFYYPLTTPARIFAPDTTDFRQPGEDLVMTKDIWDGVLSSIGLDLVEAPQFDFFQLDVAFRASKFRNSRQILFDWWDKQKISWQLMQPDKMNEFIDEIMETGKKDGSITESNADAVRATLVEEWFNFVYELVINDAVGFKKLKESRDFLDSNYSIKEWNVPMQKLSIDWSNCIVNNLSVSLSNNYATMQIQLQDQPTYQHIGGGDSRIDVSMTVIGEDNLIRFRRLFDHINGLARLEKAHGVLGFLGIKNVVTSLCGIKYILPLDMEVQTLPNFPHVYNVNMSFIDFDIMQQEREQLSVAQQTDLVKMFGKRNPFLRLKQSWGAWNAYPDFPLDLRDEDNKVLGHLDADWYFRSFKTTESDEDLFTWGLDKSVVNIVKQLSYLRLARDNPERITGGPELAQKISELEEQLRSLEASGSRLPPDLKIDSDGHIVSVTDPTGTDLPEPEMITYLGSYDKDQKKLAFIAFFKGGYFALGEEIVSTTGETKRTYKTGMSAFKEDLATTNMKDVPSIVGLTPISDYQKEYLNGDGNANRQYEAMLKDYNYRNVRGRMIRAFPTYMLWLIDEGGTFAGVKLFDNFYGLNSVIDFSVVQSEDPLSDTLIMRLSNIYSKLTTPYKDAIVTEDEATTPELQAILVSQNRQRNIRSGMTNEIIEINTIRLKPGVRIHLRMGYGANPSSLQTVFNGVITEVQPGDILTVIAQSDAVEFSQYINAQPLTAKILTPEGFVQMGDVKVGDQIIGSDGNIIKVEGISPQSERDIYKVTFKDGSETECCDQHLWEVKAINNWDGESKVVPLSYIRTRLAYKYKLEDRIQRWWKYTVPNVENVEFYEKDLRIDPYIMGLLLGDGGFSTRSVKFTTDDSELLKVMEEYFLPTGIILRKELSRDYDYVLTKGIRGPKTNWVREYFDELDLICTSPKKFIPEIYKYSSLKSRLAIFQGLQDTDATNNGPASQFSSSSFTLASDVAWLARSLGGFATITEFEYEDVKLPQGGTTISHGWRVYSRLPENMNPFRLTRKAIQVTPTKVGLRRHIVDVQWQRKDTVQCISVSAENGLYITDDFIVTHNTVNPKGSSGKLDGGLSGFWLSEPRDLMVRLLTMGSSNFKEWMAWGSKGTFFSDSRFGIRHFGNILYEPMTSSEIEGVTIGMGAVSKAVGQKPSANSSFNSILGPDSTELAEITSITNLPGAFNNSIINIGKILWLNQSCKRDYEIFKRNIYPGNGTGIAQFMGGDQIDAGITISTATAFYDKNEFSTTTIDNNQYMYDIMNGYVNAAPNPFQVGLDAATSVFEANKAEVKKEVDSIWELYKTTDGLTDEELESLLLKTSNESFNLDIKEEEEDNLFEQILGVGWEVVKAPFTAGSWLYDQIDDRLSTLPGGGFTATVLELAMGMGGVALFEGAADLVSGVGRLTMGGGNGGSSGLGRILGLQSGVDDTDLQGFDEVSFRAQTYMKTVWDLFQVCAALLPNYIVAVRPFEDRSTVFYGKPHWLYTSGVIPVTTGVPKEITALPMIEGPDTILSDQLHKIQTATSGDIERMLRVTDQSKSLKDIMNFKVGEDIDPDNAGGNRAILSTQADKEAALQILRDSDEAFAPYILEAARNKDLTFLSIDQITDLLNPAQDFYAPNTGLPSLSGPKVADQRQIQTYYNNTLDSAIARLTNRINKADISGLIEKQNEYGKNIQKLSDAEKERYFDLYKKDPITFAYQFGWRFDEVPIWFDPESGFGVDTLGTAARALYNEGADPDVDAINNDMSDGQAIDVWNDFRRGFRGSKSVKDLYNQYFPRNTDDYDAVMDSFMRFMWQDPYNRAWVVNATDKIGDSNWSVVGEVIVGAVTFGLGALVIEVIEVAEGGSNNWNFYNIYKVWESFLADGNIDIIEETGVIISPSARRYMVQHKIVGDNAKGIAQNVWEDGTNWIDENIGQLLGLVTDTITGFIASIRMSLMQMGNAVSQSGDMQRQANILNASLNNSIYYQAGSYGSFLRLVDNPFTREYGEPVIEVREPFQRIHYVSSFDSIIDNKITENLTGVATVVTAVSDGKYPQTVHFDKGISPERQIEKLVETGLLWDNVAGAGLFGFLQPLLHPLETLRGISKTVTGSSDQLSARRVALYHLKESLKDIYTGEILIIGNADIRPHDLLYIADVYERMYGMCEVEQVVHHFTPETGFVTAITPNAIVTVNDPQRWTMISSVWNAMTSYNLRDDTRAMMGIKAERAVATASEGIESSDVYKYFSTQIQGSTQFTQGSTAFIRDIGAIFSGGGREALTAKDEVLDKIAHIDIVLGAAKNLAPVAGAIGGGLLGGGVGAIPGAALGWAVSDLMWEAWQWVKENLLDQHGCYIQYLNKDGQAMDAGLSYAQGVAAGQNHSVSLFPQTMGLGGKVNVKEDGHYRITTNDILGSLGYTEVETLSLFRETSMFVNQVNAEILGLTGRDSEKVANDNFMTFKARILDPSGEVIDAATDTSQSGIEDGDTIYMKVIDSGTSGYATGSIIDVRLSYLNTFELEYHDDDSTTYNETDMNPGNDMGKLAYDYLVAKFAAGESRFVAVRVDKRNELDSFGRTIGAIFHNAPFGYIGSSERIDILYGYASKSPPIPFDSYLSDGRPYTLNWEMIMTGYGSVEMRESLWETSWRNDALEQGLTDK